MSTRTRGALKDAYNSMVLELNAKKRECAALSQQIAAAREADAKLADLYQEEHSACCDAGATIAVAIRGAAK